MPKPQLPGFPRLLALQSRVIIHKTVGHYLVDRLSTTTQMVCSRFPLILHPCEPPRVSASPLLFLAATIKGGLGGLLTGIAFAGAREWNACLLLIVYWDLCGLGLKRCGGWKGRVSRGADRYRPGWKKEQLECEGWIILLAPYLPYNTVWTAGIRLKINWRIGHSLRL